MEKAQRERVIVVVLAAVFIAIFARARFVPKKATVISSASVKQTTAEGAGEGIAVYQPKEAVIEYKPMSARDPFRSPIEKKPDKPKVEEKVELPPLNLKGIIWNVKEPMVVIDDKVLKVGETIRDVEIVKIDKGIVYLKYRNKDFTLLLTDFGGRMN